MYWLVLASLETYEILEKCFTGTKPDTKQVEENNV